MRDTDLGKSAARIPWLKDGVTSAESFELVMLDATAASDVDAARVTASLYELPWLADTAWLAELPWNFNWIDSSTGQHSELEHKRIVFEALREIILIDWQSAAPLLSLPWVVTGDISDYEMWALSDIRQMLQEFPTVATEVLGSSWIQDDVNWIELYGLNAILAIARNDLDLVWHVLESPFMDEQFLQRDEYALSVLAWISTSGPPSGITLPGSITEVDIGDGVTVGLYLGDPEQLAQFTSQPWFSDGLDDDDAALLHAINRAPANFKEPLIETNYVATTSVDLPLTGEMGLAVVRHTPFPPDDQILEKLEEGVRILEDFMGAPMPVGDVTLILVEPEFWIPGRRGDISGFTEPGNPRWPAAYVTAAIRVVNRETGPPIRTIYHELGHYYLLSGPRWLSEGMANFLEAYIVASIGGQGLEERLARLDLLDGCAENIWEHVNPYRGGQCDYRLGEKLLLGMYAALGPDAVSAALRELHARTLINDPLDHDNVYYAFQSNVPVGKEEAFQTAWRRYHGGPVIDQVHTDHPARPALVALYEATEGEHWGSNNNWLSDAPLGAWHGVYTNSQGQVIGLELDKNIVTGELPPELGDLSNLKGLFLGENRLTGKIPPELGNLIHLEILRLDANYLTGNIPPELGNLTNLRSLGLNLNRLSGEIPHELANLTKLGPPLWFVFSTFTGCLAPELPEIWDEYLGGLKRCEP